MIRERISRINSFGKAGLAAAAGFLALTCAQPVWAETEGAAYGIYDNAGLLTGEENSDITGELEALADKSGWEVYILTIEDAGVMRPVNAVKRFWMNI